MYESPVRLIMSDIKLQVDEKLEEACYTAVMEYFPNVNREELIRALQYDRQQYEQGYRDAKAEIVHCEECIHYGTTKHGMRKCRIFTEMCGEGFFAPDADFFCGEGERRTE
jgi:hypothetical protein